MINSFRNHCRVRQWKNFENRSTFVRVMGMNKSVQFFDSWGTAKCRKWLHVSTYSSVTGRLHGTIGGPTGRCDWSVRLVGSTIVSCKRFVRPVGQTVGRIKRVWFRPTADPTVEACGHYVRLVGPTGQSDDQSRCSVGGTCCLRHSYIAQLSYTLVVANQLAGHIDLIDRCGQFGYSLSDRSVRLVWQTSRT